MSSSEQENIVPSSKRGQGRGRRRGRGRMEELTDEEVLQNIRSARHVTQRRIARLPAALKKKLAEQKHVKEVVHVLLPDAPPRKRRTRRQSPERELCEIVTSPQVSVHDDPVPSTSAQEDAFILGPSTSAQADATPNSLPPLIIVPAEINIEDYDLMVPEVEIEVGVLAPRAREQASNDSKFEETVADWLGDSDSDMDIDVDDSTTMTQPYYAMTIDLTPQQEQILQYEDSANDRALHDLLPGNCFSFNWTHDRSTFTSKRETFIGHPGPTFDVTVETSPTDIFEKMIDVEFIDILVTETNRYAVQKIAALKAANKMSVNSRLHRWTPTDRHEIISFLSLLILQGLYPLPNEESYFTFNGFGTMPYFSRIMTYNRFLLLKCMLHFTDNETLADGPTKSKLSKIQPVIDYFNDKFTSLYYPKQEIAIDESLLKWCGILSFSQKINSKAAQVGVKTYELCESASGYLWRFSVYAGKNKTSNDNDARADLTDRPDDPDLTDGPDMTDLNDITDVTELSEIPDVTELTDRPDVTELTDRPDVTDSADRQDVTDGQTSDFRPANATAKIVFDLIEPLLHRGHTVIMDNFYNCPLLARCLKNRKTDCYGTQRLNREFIPDSLRTLTKASLRHGEVVATYCSDLSLMVWRDANLVSMISTYHPLQVGTQEKNNRTAYKPSIVLDYNKHMGGVDRKDQYLSAQPLERVRNRVWYKKLFRRLFNCAIFNSFIIFNTKHKLSHRQFRTVLAESLLKTYRQLDLTTETRLITRTNTQTGQITRFIKRNSHATKIIQPYVQGEHFPIHAETKRSRCWWCANKKNTVSRTVWKCLECDVSLCIVGCFRDFHKL